MITSTNNGHSFDTPPPEKLIAHPALARAASFGAAASVLALAAILLVTMKVSWHPQDQTQDAPAFSLEQWVDRQEPPPPRPQVQRPPVQPQTEPTEPTTQVASTEPAQATTQPVGASVITQPHWLSMPNARDFERYYPARALERGVGGRVILDCTVGADGRLACAVASEDPQGQSFGAAAMQIAHSFRMAPQTVDGQATDGGRVRVPITFRAQ